jgi:hypothetical protein
MDTIVVVTGASVNGNDLTNEHQGDRWSVEEGSLHIYSDEDGILVSYPVGGWYRVERIRS